MHKAQREGEGPPRWNVHPEGRRASSCAALLFNLCLGSKSKTTIYLYVIIWLECPNKTPGTWSFLLKLSYFDQNAYPRGQMVGAWICLLTKTESVCFFLLQLINMVYEQRSLPHWALRVQTRCSPCFLMVKKLLSEFQCLG